MNDVVDTLIEDLERLVAAAASLESVDLDRELVDRVGVVFADTVGVIAAGARSSEVRALVEDPDLGLGSGESRVLAPGTPRGAPVTTAWLNGTAGTFLELDEGVRPTGHPAIHVLPAALAAAEAVRAPGAELVRAIVAGYEVAARLFESFRLPTPMHPHGHFGAIGAATAVAMLYGEDPVALARIAATQPLLTGWEACYDGATARNTWSGHANRVGVLSAVLHRSGFTGSTASHLSVVAPYLVPAPTLDDPVRAESARIRRNYLKLHSACALTHAALDATVETRARLSDPNPERIREVTVRTVTNNLRVARQARPNPLSTRFSLPYAVAAVLVTGDSGPGAFTWRADVAELASRVRVEAAEELDAGWPATAPAAVRIHTDHEVVDSYVDNPRGHHDRPVGDEVVRAKFVALGGTSAAFDALAQLAAVEDCSTLPLDVATWLGH